MAISSFSRRKLANALGSQSAANAILTIVDAGSGTVAQDSIARLASLIGTTEAVVLAAAIGADTALTDPVLGRLTQVIGRTAVAELTAVQG